MAIYKNKASQKLAVYAYDLTTGLPKTGDAANITAQISKDGGATAATNDVNPTELDAADAKGIYLFDATQAESNADMIVLSAVSATADIALEPLVIYTQPEQRIAASVAGSVGSVTGHTNQTADHTASIATILSGTPTLKYMGPRGPGVYIDSGAANTNTVTGTDGTVDNPVSTFAAARTIADAIGVTRYYLEGNSDSTLAATHVDWEFIGVGSVADNIVNLGSQDVSRSLFMDLTLEGTQGGAGRIEAIECALQDPGAGATTLHIFALRCGLVDDIEVDTSNNNVFDSCYSLVAGATTPKIIATGAAGTIEIRHYSGGIELSTLSASHNVSIEGMGQVVFTADCNVNANVSIRGLFTITDNTAGMTSLTQDAVVNMSKINAEADTAISDAALATAAALTTVDTVVDGIQTDLSNGTDGLGALKTLIDLVKAVTDVLPDSGALTSLAQAAVLGALADSAATGAPTSADTIMAYMKQAINSTSRKNVAQPDIPLLMVLASDHVTPAVGLTVTATRSLDGGTWAAVSGTIAEVGNGAYSFDATAADKNGTICQYRFVAATADDRFLTIVNAL